MAETDLMTTSIKPESRRLSRRILQAILAILASVPLATGLLGMLRHADAIHGLILSRAVGGHVIVDSNYRYFSGLWLGVGVIMLWIIPTMERQKTALRILSTMIFLGGIGRILSMITFAIPRPAFIFFTVLEIFFPLHHSPSERPF